jgi:dTDP-4-dehydrorhamnose 3,5-epimerase
MRFEETPLEGCLLLRLAPSKDARGSFVRTYCAEEFACHGLTPDFVQTSVSFSRRRGTLRGLHFQAEPAMEEKLVRCDQGAIFDVAVDLRPASGTFGRWYGAELSEDNDRELYLPRGFAHGFQTLTDDVRMTYHIGPAFRAELSAGIRWDDPDVGVAWPLPPVDQSPRDLTLPRLAELEPTAIGVGAR